MRSAPTHDLAAWFDTHVGLTDHALERFAERAQPPAVDEAYLRAALRDLVWCEGRIVRQRPHWSRSDRPAALYLQINDFLLLVLENDQRRPGRYTCVTIVNGMRDKTWRLALDRHWVFLPPPPPRPVVVSDGEIARIQADVTVASRKAIPAVPRPPMPGGLPVTPSWWRGWRKRAQEIRRQSEAVRAARDAWTQEQMEPYLARQRQQALAEQQWRAYAWPAYEANRRAARDRFLRAAA